MKFQFLLITGLAMAHGFLLLHPSKTLMRFSTAAEKRRRIPLQTAYSFRASTGIIRRQESETAGMATNSTSASLKPSDDDTAAETILSPIDQQEQKLWSYVHNLSKARQLKTSSERHTAVRPILYSYMGFISGELKEHLEVHQKSLEASLIQAMRAAGDIGDYRLVIRLIETMTAGNTGSLAFRVSPRIFGEAFAAMSGTSANVSKLKRIWSMAVEYMGSEGLTAFELNVMLQALAKRGRIRAALHLYETAGIVGDAYSLSTLFVSLMESIVDDQEPSRDWAEEKEKLCSPCWQYNEAYKLLQESLSDQVNNEVAGAALKLNDRASQVFSTPTARHYVSQHAMEILQFLKQREISADVVTCSLVLSAFDRGYQWKAAVTLLDAMIRDRSPDEWKLPRPNVYAYASTISACARCQEYEAAMGLLERMTSSDENDVAPNTWVYNAALAACVGGRRHGRDLRVAMTQTLLQQMQRQAEEGLDTAPDTVSYNTILAALEGCAPHEAEGAVNSALEDMIKHGLARDSITYGSAIKALRCNGPGVLIMLDEAVRDLCSSLPSDQASDGLHFVFQNALSVLANQEDFVLVESLFTKMKKEGIYVNVDGVAHLISALGKSRQSDSILTLLEALSGSKEALKAFEERHQLGLAGRAGAWSLPSLSLKHCSSAIASLLTSNELESALKVLSLMRENHLTPDDQSMQAIVLAYCRLSTTAAAEESRIGRKRRKAKKAKRSPSMEEARKLSTARARSAIDIAFAMKEPKTRLLSTLATTCSAAGLWDEARTILCRIHIRALEESLSSFHSMNDGRALQYLPGLHRSLLKLCASRGNVTAAVGFVDDIQSISQRLASAEEAPVSISDFLHDCSDDSVEETLAVIERSFNGSSDGGKIGMGGEEWKLLLIAASKSGHWKLCLCTMQFLRPFLEDLRPNVVTSRRSVRQYDKLVRSLTAVVLCCEMRSQYAWAVRAIDDWIDWSGRRPRTEAVVSACRILAARGHGYEVNQLVSRLLQVPSGERDEVALEEASYETIVYVGALNALHSHGLYEDADELFIHAFTENHLPFEVERDETLNQFTLDLHGFNVAMANSAVRIALQQQVLPQNWNQIPDSPSLMEETPRESDMVVITGRGVNSAQRLRPILRPEVQRMLLEEFYPPLGTTSIPGNMGALRISAKDVKAWVVHQRQQKGARMLAVADVLKGLSSGDRIRSALKRCSEEQDEEEILE